MLFEINNKKIILFFLCGGERERERERERGRKREITLHYFFLHTCLYSQKTHHGALIS